jgi:hypothetical protein
MYLKKRKNKQNDKVAINEVRKDFNSAKTEKIN